MTLCVLNVGQPDAADDPFVGFSEVWPLFMPDPSGTRYQISPAHYTFFQPASFEAIKPPGEFRIFCIGGSTVHGSPFAAETAFPAWLEISLNTLAPERSWRVINCGGISYATYRLAIVLKEILRHHPDLIVLYEGHNEFLEERTYRVHKSLPAAVERPLEAISRMRSFQLLRSAIASATQSARDLPIGRSTLGPEVMALLDYQGGLDAYRRDDSWRRSVIEHFDFNLRRMVRLAREAGVPIVLMNPVSNLEIPPFKSQHRDDMSAGDNEQFDALCAEASDSRDRRLPAVIDRLERAAAIDDRHAGVHYNLAKNYQRYGRLDDARREFIRAKDEDVCPLRILEPMHQILLNVAHETNTPLLDVDALFSARSAGGITGGEWLVDHVHPSFVGHQLIANSLTDLLADQGYLIINSQQIPERDRRYREHMAGLDPAYFLLGQKRLENQRLWSAGEGNRVRGTSASTPRSAQKNGRPIDRRTDPHAVEQP